MDFYLLVDYVSIFLAINLDSVRPVRLPMSGKDDDSLWLNFGGDFFPDLRKLWIDRVVEVVHDVRLRTISKCPTLDDALAGLYQIQLKLLTPPWEKK